MLWAAIASATVNPTVAPERASRLGDALLGSGGD